MNPLLRYAIVTGGGIAVGVVSTKMFGNPLIGLVLAIATAIALYLKLK